MTTYTVNSFEELFSHIAKLLEKKDLRIKQAIKDTIDFAVIEIKKNAPVALGDTIKSIHKQNDYEVVIDAPHAAALEVGSRPHMPPLAPLIEWAKQQPSTAFGDDPVKLARIVQHAISVKGTKPKFFVRKSMTEIGKYFLSRLEEELAKQEHIR